MPSFLCVRDCSGAFFCWRYLASKKSGNGKPDPKLRGGTTKKSEGYAQNNNKKKTPEKF